MDTIGEQEKPSLQEVSLDRQTAIALGNGLRQIFPDSSQKEILENVGLLAQKLTDDKDKKYLDIIERNANRAKDFLKAIGESAEIRLVTSNGGSDFIFSDDKEQEEKPQQGEIVLNEDLSYRLRSALRHNLNNIFTPIIGFSSLISSSTRDLGVKEKSDSITEKSNLMIGEFTSTNQGHHQMRFITDSQGKTVISDVLIK